MGKTNLEEFFKKSSEEMKEKCKTTDLHEETVKDEEAKDELLKEMRSKAADEIIKEHSADKSVSKGDTPITVDNFVDRTLGSPVIEVTPEKEDDKTPYEAETTSDFLRRTYGPNEPDIPEFSYPNFGGYNPAAPSYGVYGGGRFVNANARFMDTITRTDIDADERDKCKYYENRSRMDVEWNRKHTDLLAASWSSFGGYNDHRPMPMPPRIKDRYTEWLECRINKMYDKLTVRQLNLLNAVNASSSKKSVVKLIDTLQMLVAEGVFDEDFDVDAAIKADIDEFNKAT